MNNINEDIILLEELLCLSLPRAYVAAVLEKELHESKIPLLGLPLSLDLTSVWGATEFLRAARPDLHRMFIPIQMIGSLALCMDLAEKPGDDVALVQIDMDHPKSVCDSISLYLEKLKEGKDLWEVPVEGIDAEDNWFQHGLNRLDWHMENLAFQYDHEKGGQLPRNHVWRPYRFCVQDIILGITVIRHDRKYNRLEADVFLTAQIPEYEPDSGCRALALILLSDAYKSGGPEKWGLR